MLGHAVHLSPSSLHSSAPLPRKPRLSGSSSGSLSDFDELLAEMGKAAENHHNHNDDEEDDGDDDNSDEQHDGDEEGLDIDSEDPSSPRADELLLLSLAADMPPAPPPPFSTGNRLKQLSLRLLLELAHGPAVESPGHPASGPQLVGHRSLSEAVLEDNEEDPSGTSLGVVGHRSLSPRPRAAAGRVATSASASELSLKPPLRRETSEERRAWYPRLLSPRRGSGSSSHLPGGEKILECLLLEEETPFLAYTLLRALRGEESVDMLVHFLADRGQLFRCVRLLLNCENSTSSTEFLRESSPVTKIVRAVISLFVQRQVHERIYKARAWRQLLTARTPEEESSALAAMLAVIFGTPPSVTEPLDMIALLVADWLSRAEQPNEESSSAPFTTIPTTTRPSPTDSSYFELSPVGIQLLVSGALGPKAPATKQCPSLYFTPSQLSALTPFVERAHAALFFLRSVSPVLCNPPVPVPSRINIRLARIVQTVANQKQPEEPLPGAPDLNALYRDFCALRNARIVQTFSRQSELLRLRRGRGARTPSLQSLSKHISSQGPAILAVVSAPNCWSRFSSPPPPHVLDFIQSICHPPS
ncbi:MAG: hypothetical protein Q8P67_24445 [archaeon]|nr:hypothetical protein [archaeon]